MKNCYLYSFFGGISLYKVVFSSQMDYEYSSLKESILSAVNSLGGISQFVKPEDSVLIKPNLLSARSPEKRITTDPTFVMAVVEIVKEAGGRPVIADSPPGIESFRLICERTGMEEIAQRTKVPLVELRKPRKGNTAKCLRFSSLEVSAEALEADVIINLPKMKTHCQMLLSLGVKNIFGTVISREKAEWHYRTGLDRDTFATLLLDIHNTLNPDLTILDGVWGMEGHGPSGGTPRNFGIIAASADALALDLSVSEMMGINPSDFPLYRVAKKHDLPQARVKNIEVIADPEIRNRFVDTNIPRLDSLHVLPSFLRILSPLLISNPVQDSGKCIGCGECVKICRAEAIELKDHNRLEFNYDKCIRCFCCQEVCPVGAIGFKKGWLLKFRDLMNRKVK